MPIGNAFAGADLRSIQAVGLQIAAADLTFLTVAFVAISLFPVLVAVPEEAAESGATAAPELGGPDGLRLFPAKFAGGSIAVQELGALLQTNLLTAVPEFF